VAYTPPAGWVEQLGTLPGSAMKAQRFHVCRDCPTVTATSVLQRTDKPYSAARCPACAT